MQDVCIYSNVSKCECGMSLEEAKDIFEPAKLVIEGVLLIGINVFGFFANAIAINILYKTNLTSLFNKTLFILAIFDLLFNVCDILEVIRRVHYDRETCSVMPNYQKLHLYLTPQIIRPLRMFVIIASMYTTVVIALERYIAVSKPLMTFIRRDEDKWKKLLFRVIPVLLISLILSLPISFEFVIDDTCFLCFDNRRHDTLSKEVCQINHLALKCENNSISCVNSEIQSKPEESEEKFFEKGLEMSSFHSFCNFRTIPIMRWTKLRMEINENENGSKAYGIIYRNILLGIFTYVVPLVALFVLNWLIYKHIRGRRKVIKDLGIDTPLIDLQNENRRQQMQKIQQMEDKQLKILFGVCILFVICHTCRIFRHFEELYHKSMDIIKPKPCNEGCASIFTLSTHMMGSINKLLLAISHSFNLIIYWLSSIKFEKCLYFGKYHSSPEPKSERVQRKSTIGEEIGTMREICLTIQKALDKTGEPNTKDDIEMESDTCPSILQSVINPKMTSRRNDVLQYLDLAVVAYESNTLPFNVMRMDSNQSKSCAILHR